MKLETYDKIEARTRTCELRDIDNHYHHRSLQKRIAFVSLHQCFRVPQRDILIFIVINLCLTDRLNYTPDATRTSRNILFIKPSMSRTLHKRSTYPTASSHRISYIRYIHRVNNRTRSLEENRNHQLTCVFNHRSCGFRPNRCTCRWSPALAMGSSVSQANLNSDKSK